MTTTADRNDLMPAQEKLEWVTPKISLMEAGETRGQSNQHISETNTLPELYSWSFLNNYTSNPATPTKTSHRKGSAKTLF